MVVPHSLRGLFSLLTDFVPILAGGISSKLELGLGKLLGRMFRWFGRTFFTWKGLKGVGSALGTVGDGIS